MDEPELRRIRRKVTWSSSRALFDSLTVAENVLFSLEQREDYDEQNKEDVVDGLLEWWISPRRATPTPPISPPATSGRRHCARHRRPAAMYLYDEPTTMVDPIMGTTRHMMHA